VRTYVIKSKKNIKLFLYLLFKGLRAGISSSILPASFGSRDLIIFPFGSIKTVLPLLADLTKNFFDSIALKTAFAKC